MREQTLSLIKETKIIAIVRGMGEDHIVPLAGALLKGGIRLIEVTFNQADPSSFATTTRAITAIRDKFGGEVRVGAGTVITDGQLQMAADAGAEYIISPNTDERIIRRTRELNLVSLPGAMTASECVAAHNAGADYVKLFPIGNLGADYLKALRAPLSHIGFLCVGGVTVANIPEFIKAGAVGFGVGGNLVNKEWIVSGQLDKITTLAKEYIDAARGSGR